jgi:hypothetical protein
MKQAVLMCEIDGKRVEANGTANAMGLEMATRWVLQVI